MSNKIPGDQFGVPFEQEEYDGRLTKVRKIMQEKGIDLFMVREPINIFYMTGYNTFGLSNYAILFIPIDGELSLFVRYLEKQIAYKTTNLKNIYSWEDHENPFEATKKLMQEKNWLNKNVSFEMSTKAISLRDFEILKDTLGIDFVDGSGIIEEVRKIKSPIEVEFLKKAARFTEAGMQAGMKSLAENKTENEVTAKVYEAMIAAGSEFPATNPIMTGGWKSGIPHTTFHRLKLKKGDVILFEIGGVYNRYIAALMRSAVIGEPEEEVVHLNNICAEAVQAAIDKIKPGVTSGEVDEACRGIIEKAGYYENFRKRTGYSIGCAYPPSWMEAHIIDLKKDDPRILEEGMVFHMPPALRVEGKYGVGVSETVLVTKNGCESITNFDRKLYVAE